VTGRNSAGATPGPVWSFVTAPLAPSPGSTTLNRLKLLTWNVQHGYDATNTEAIDAQVALMVDSNADIIGLQEITIESGKDLSALYKAKLEASTGYTWNSVWAPAPRASIYTPEGNLILTRLPIAASSTAAWDTMPGSPDMIGSKRAAARVEVIVNYRPVNVIITHLDTDVNTRTQQLSLLMQWASSFASPRIIGGDFNMMPAESDHAAMATQFPDAWDTLFRSLPGGTGTGAGLYQGRADHRTVDRPAGPNRLLVPREHRHLGAADRDRRAEDTAVGSQRADDVGEGAVARQSHAAKNSPRPTRKPH
jgi:endonuclease/exonuclease/phosphatase family metal-dependent hydrolase